MPRSRSTFEKHFIESKLNTFIEVTTFFNFKINKNNAGKGKKRLFIEFEKIEFFAK